MHEFSIMESALSEALARAREAGASRIHGIRLRVGALSGVVPEALKFAFEALARGTPAEAARLDLETVPAVFWCGSCRREFEAESMIAECPDCSAPSADLRAGRELELACMEIE